MANQRIIDELVQKYQSEIDAFQGKKVVTTFYDIFRKVMTEHLQAAAATVAAAAATRSTSGATATAAATAAATATKGRGRVKRAAGGEGEKPKLDQWPKIWTSKEFGGSSYFKDLYEEIKAKTKETNHFKVLKLLRDEVERDDRWATYVRWVQENNEHAPKDAPSERKPPSERKKSPTSPPPAKSAVGGARPPVSGDKGGGGGSSSGGADAGGDGDL